MSYRGVPHGPQRKREKIDQAAAEMRQKYLTSGKGCKSKLRAILARTGQNYSPEDRP